MQTDTPWSQQTQVVWYPAEVSRRLPSGANPPATKGFSINSEYSQCEVSTLVIFDITGYISRTNQLIMSFFVPSCRCAVRTLRRIGWSSSFVRITSELSSLVRIIFWWGFRRWSRTISRTVSPYWINCSAGDRCRGLKIYLLRPIPTTKSTANSKISCLVDMYLEAMKLIW